MSGDGLVLVEAKSIERNHRLSEKSVHGSTELTTNGRVNT